MNLLDNIFQFFNNIIIKSKDSKSKNFAKRYINNNIKYYKNLDKKNLKKIVIDLDDDSSISVNGILCHAKIEIDSEVFKIVVSKEKRLINNKKLFIHCLNHYLTEQAYNDLNHFNNYSTQKDLTWKTDNISDFTNDEMHLDLLYPDGNICEITIKENNKSYIVYAYTDSMCNELLNSYDSNKLDIWVSEALAQIERK